LALAVREWKEALRLRPHSDVGKELARVEALLEIPTPPRLSLAQFAAHFNLAVHYWDSGRAGLALSEAKKAVRAFELVFPGQDCGCARHHIKAIQQAPTAEGKSDYSRGVALFDRRMLRAAERHFRAALEEARLRREPRAAGIADDLKYVGELRDEFSRQRGPLLPCLLARFAPPAELEECRRWWEKLRDDERVTWN